MNAKFALLLSFWTFWAAITVFPIVFNWNTFSILFLTIYLSAYTVGVMILYKRLVRKVRRYPLAFPGGVDQYFPHFNIPRPIYLDLSEHPEYFEEGGDAEEE